MQLDPQDQSFAFQYWWLLPLILLLPLLAILRGKRGTHSAISFGSLHILKRLGPSAKTKVGGFKLPILLMLTLALGLVALARPQFIRKYKVVKESGIEMILAIDVSRSMLVQDMMLANTRVDRLTAARAVIRNFVRRRPMDRIGLVAFAGRPYLASPITLDHEWVQKSLGRVRVGLVEDGTAIGSAIAASARRLDKREAKSKVVVLLTDGSNNAGNLAPVTAAELANTLGVKIYSIAVGTPGQHTIPTPNGPQALRQEFDRDTLQKIADAAGGKFFMAEDTENLEQIFTFIDQLETTEREARVRIDPTDFFQIFLALMIFTAIFRLIANETFLRTYP